MVFSFSITSLVEFTVKLLAAANGYIVPDKPPYWGSVVFGISDKLMSDVVQW